MNVENDVTRDDVPLVLSARHAQVQLLSLFLLSSLVSVLPSLLFLSPNQPEFHFFRYKLFLPIPKKEKQIFEIIHQQQQPLNQKHEPPHHTHGRTMDKSINNISLYLLIM